MDLIKPANLDVTCAFTTPNSVNCLGDVSLSLATAHSIPQVVIFSAFYLIFGVDAGIKMSFVHIFYHLLRSSKSIFLCCQGNIEAAFFNNI